MPRHFLTRHCSMAVLAGCFALAAIAATGGSVAGSLDSTEITNYRVWQSTRCYKPRPPTVQIVDPLSFNLAIEGFNQYLAHMRRYLECAEQEANEDFASLKQALEQGLARTRGEALQDLEAAQEEIEQFRSLYSPPETPAAGQPNQQ